MKDRGFSSQDNLGVGGVADLVAVALVAAIVGLLINIYGVLSAANFGG